MIDFPTCGVLTGNGITVPIDQLPELRKNLGSLQGRDLNDDLRHADDMTVLAIAAVDRTLSAAGWQNRSFADWGVVASARGFGRARVATSIHRYRRRNARGISPMVIPTMCLHAIAGGLSIAMRAHGPNFSVSGHRDHLSESLLAGLGLIEHAGVEGVWVVCCEYDPEPIVTPDGELLSEPDQPAFGNAVAVALSREAASYEITLGPGTPNHERVSDLIHWFQTGGRHSWTCGVTGAGVLELRNTGFGRLRRAG